MLLELFGLATPQPPRWVLENLPAGGGAELEQLIRQHAEAQLRDYQLWFEQRRLADLDHTQLTQCCEHVPSAGHVLRLIARPDHAIPKERIDHPGLNLVTTTGPDAGRLVPVTREPLSVGRQHAHYQINDPYLLDRDFSVHLTQHTTQLTTYSPLTQPAETSHERSVSSQWPAQETLSRGQTSFRLVSPHYPRLPELRAPAVLEIDPGPEPQPPNVVLQLVMAASPMIIGLVMMVVTGMWYFLLFSAISVIVAVVMISQYRAKRRKFIATITRLSTEQGQHRLNETYTPDQLRFALRSIAPDPLGLLRPHLATPTIRWGDGILAVKLVRSDADEKWAQHTQVHTAIAQHLAPGSTTVVRGLPEQLASVTHWLLAQCHHHAAATQQRVWVHTNPERDKELIDSVLPSTIIDTTGTLTRDDLDQKFARTPLVRIEQVDENCPRPPASQEVVFDVSDGSVSGLGQDISQINFFGISVTTLDLVTSRLLSQLPATRSHSPLLSLPSTFFTAHSAGDLRVEIDARDSADALDLVADGPHVLITGTTGSGKSELLLTVLAQLAMNYPADQLSMVLLDFKGGSSFAVLEDLPHVMAVETNLSAGLSLRSLGAIEAELHRREKLFAEYRVPDYSSFRQNVPHVVLPRLVVAIDELKMLIEDHRQAQDVLIRLASTGRSLGFHLVLATQRAQGTVTSDVRANLGSVLCLRTATEQDSWDLIGDASAYRISASQPGRGILRRGPADSEIFQTPIMRLPSEPVTLTPVFADRPVSTKTVATTKWPRVVSLITQAHEQAGLLCPDPIVLPSLPEHWNPSTQSTDPLTPTSGMILGLVDHPTERMQAPIWWNPKTTSSEATPQSGRKPWILTGSLAVIGASGSGAEKLLDRAVTAFFNQHHQGDPWPRIANKVAIFDGRPHREESSVERAIHITESSQNRWSFHAECTGEELEEALATLREILQAGQQLTIIIRHFSAWASRIPGRGFESFEDRLMTLIRDFPNTLKILIHGGRELAAGRTVGLITDRIYLGFGSTEEHRMVWPRIRQAPHIPYRGVLVGRGWPVQGLEIQLAE